MRSFNRLTVNFPAIGQNLTSIQNILPPHTQIMPMVKADAYGTGALQLAAYHQERGISILGVSHVSEAVALREAGITCALFVIGPAPREIPEIVHYSLQPAISNLSFCKTLNERARAEKKVLSVHLHINTGMHRFGCSPEEALEWVDSIRSLPGLHLEGILTHFLGATSSEFDAVSDQQIDAFYHLLKAIDPLPPSIHIANSSGVLRFSIPFANLVRVGLAQFGIYGSEADKGRVSLTPALSLESEIVGINHCKRGESVGYAQGYGVKREQERIAILPLGYHDGVHLAYNGKGYALIHGKPAPYVGKICMDFMMVDVTEIPEAHVGDNVVIFGEKLPPEKVAGWIRTNVRELIACLGPRIKRQYIIEEEHDHDISSTQLHETAHTF